MDQEFIDRTEKLIQKKELEINTLLTEGHIPERDAKKILNLCKSFRREVVKPDFNRVLIFTKYGEMFINHRFLYHPENQDKVRELIEDLKS